MKSYYFAEISFKLFNMISVYPASRSPSCSFNFYFSYSIFFNCLVLSSLCFSLSSSLLFLTLSNYLSLSVMTTCQESLYYLKLYWILINCFFNSSTSSYLILAILSFKFIIYTSCSFSFSNSLSSNSRIKLCKCFFYFISAY